VAGADLRGAKLAGGVFSEIRYDTVIQSFVGFDPFCPSGLVPKERM
jgi:hypothetical protein